MVKSIRHPRDKGNTYCPCVVVQLFIKQHSRDSQRVKLDFLFIGILYLFFRAAVIQN